MENDGEDGKDIRRRIIGEDDIEKDSVGVVELEKITPVEEKARSLLDCMHFMPHFFYRNLRYMNGLLPTPSVMADLPAFSECINGLFRDKNGLPVDSMEIWKKPGGDYGPCDAAAASIPSGARWIHMGDGGHPSSLLLREADVRAEDPLLSLSLQMGLPGLFESSVHLCSV